jgi:twinkle protein
MDRVFLYNHFGSTDWSRIAEIIRHCALNEGVKLFYLDHLTALADPSNERESLEIIMEEMASLAQQLRVWIGFVSHLSTPEKGSHEEGAQVSLKHFKGARAIGFWTHFAFGLERNKVAEDPSERCILTIRCIKDRLTGRGDGQTMKLRYDQKTCRLIPMAAQTQYGGVDFSAADDDPPVPQTGATPNEPEDDPLPF